MTRSSLGAIVLAVPALMLGGCREQGGPDTSREARGSLSVHR